MVPRARIDNAGWSDRLAARARAFRRWRRASTAGRVASWALSLGAVQAGLLLLLAPPVARQPAVALPTLAIALAGLAAMVIAMVWFARMLAPRASRALPAVTAAFVYGGLALLVPGGQLVVATAMLPAALAWTAGFPRGAFVVRREPRAVMRARSCP